MAIDPDKVELKPRAPEVKESMSSPVGEMAAAAESLVMLFQKINDLADAKKAIIVARDVYKKGDVGRAQDLVKGIFDRLKQIGKAPKGMDVSEVQRYLTQGKYEDLAVEIEKVRGAGEAKNSKKGEQLVKRIKDIKREKLSADTPEEKGEKAANEAKNKQLSQDIGDEVGVERSALDKEEEAIQAELLELVKDMESDKRVVAKAELEEIRESIEVGEVGEVTIKERMTGLRDKIKKNFEDQISRESGGRKTRGAAVTKAVMGKDKKSAMERLVESVKQSSKGEQVFIKRLEKLVGGMDKVNDRIDKGLGLQEAVRSLAPDEIRELRTLLSSLGEIKDVDERPVYYDEQYVEFVNGLSLDERDIVGLKKTLETIDLEYRHEQLNKPPAPRVGGPRRFAEADPDIDEETGRVIGGMQLGLMSEGERAEEYAKGEERFKELFVETSDGGFVERSLDEQLRRKRLEIQQYGYQKLEQRESFLNINMQELFKYMDDLDKVRLEDHLKSGGKKEDFLSYHDMIDHEYYREHGVAKLKDQYMSPVEGSREAEFKNEFEMWWYQEVSFNQRNLAYEGLFEKRNQSTRMVRLNSLMEIIGVSTSKKGLANWMAMSYSTIDQQNNSYVNEEFMGKLAAFWTNQGVDFRLEHMLKEFREEMAFAEGEFRRNIYLKGPNGKESKERASIAVDDMVTFMQQEITDPELRAKLGIPEWWKGKIGTMVYKYSESKKRGETRRIIWDHFMEKELGVDWSSVPADKLAGIQADIFNRYSLMFDLGFQYSVVHKDLSQMFGNASFEKGSIELPGAAAEMHLKMDPLCYSRLFAPRFQFLNFAFREGFMLYDPAVRDNVTMAPQDYASHLSELSKLKSGEIRANTNNGAPTISTMFFGGRTDAEALAAEIEIKEIFNGKYVNDKLVKEGALWHWGRKPGEGKDGEMNGYLELGVYGDQKSSYRRSAGEIAKHLLANKPSQRVLEMIDFTKYAEMTHSPVVKRKMIEAGADKNKQWEVFATTFGEHSFNYETPSAKRSGDHPVKYSHERYNKYNEAFMAWIEDPFNQEKFDALLNVPTAVNAGAVNGLAEKNLKFLLMMSKQMGRRGLGGGKMKRFARDPDKNTISVNTEDGLGGEGDNEWPSIKFEEIKNNNWWWDPVQNKSIPESFGIGVPEDSQILLDLIKGQRAKGRLSDNLYRQMYREIANGVWWEGKKGVLINAYNILTLKALTDWLGPMLGITGYEMRKVIGENTEKTASNMLKYLNS